MATRKSKKSSNKKRAPAKQAPAKKGGKVAERSEARASTPKPIPTKQSRSAGKAAPKSRTPLAAQKKANPRRTQQPEAEEPLSDESESELQPNREPFSTLTDREQNTEDVEPSGENETADDTEQDTDDSDEAAEEDVDEEKLDTDEEELGADELERVSATESVLTDSGAPSLLDEDEAPISQPPSSEDRPRIAEFIDSAEFDVSEGPVAVAEDMLDSMDEVGDTGSLLRSAIEALLFVAEKPVTIKDLAKGLQLDKKRTQELLDELRAEYNHRGIRIEEISDGYAFRTHPSIAEYVRAFLEQRPVKLSRAQLETLAIVAYRQPITRPEVDDIRGVDCGPVLKGLLERELVRILGKKDEPGRPMLYGTTPGFLELFGLKSLQELPTLREFAELTDDSRRKYEEKMGEDAPAPSLADFGLMPEGDGENAVQPAPQDEEAPGADSITLDGLLGAAETSDFSESEAELDAILGSSVEQPMRPIAADDDEADEDDDEADEDDDEADEDDDEADEDDDEADEDDEAEAADDDEAEAHDDDKDDEAEAADDDEAEAHDEEDENGEDKKSP
jgi:segregation and condensation protein B